MEVHQEGLPVQTFKISMRDHDYKWYIFQKLIPTGGQLLEAFAGISSNQIVGSTCHFDPACLRLVTNSLQCITKCVSSSGLLLGFEDKAGKS
ncbi:hypothetical protein E2C01_002112 [Portunus trituberculatus]|uniref:Uncharacterized protein n=1 Tax=Portunus trituberculatus TaxID=210409 RepID=A0A5B7CJ08_PORTR|nr:hypothetical protein [Portunus trituberculatus]